MVYMDDPMSHCDILHITPHSFENITKHINNERLPKHHNIHSFLINDILFTTLHNVTNNDSIVSYISKTPELLIGTIPVFIFLFIMLLITLTIIHNCNGGCDNEEDNNETSVEFATQDNDNGNR